MASEEISRLVTRLETAVNRLEAITTRPAVAPKPGHLVGGQVWKELRDLFFRAPAAPRQPCRLWSLLPTWWSTMRWLALQWPPSCPSPRLSAGISASW